MKPILSRLNRKYGFRPGLVDPNAQVYALRLTGLRETLPISVDLEADCPPVYDQGQEGSCTANAIAFVFDFRRKQQGLPFINPSRDFIYYQELKKEGNVGQDLGAFGGDGMTALQTIGVPPESDWPYTATGYERPPTPAALAAAAPHKVITAELLNPKLNGIYELKHALANRLPIAYGIPLYESFESEAVARTGIVPDPKRGESLLGGHETAIIGYDDGKGMFKARNSWSAKWGQRGYFWISYNYVLKSGSDFRVITQVTDGTAPVPIPVPVPAFRRETDYAIGDTVVCVGKWFEKVKAESNVQEYNVHTIAIWKDDMGIQYEPTLGFTTGTTPPAFYQLPNDIAA